MKFLPLPTHFERVGKRAGEAEALVIEVVAQHEDRLRADLAGALDCGAHQCRPHLHFSKLRQNGQRGQRHCLHRRGDGAQQDVADDLALALRHHGDRRLRRVDEAQRQPRFIGAAESLRLDHGYGGLVGRAGGADGQFLAAHRSPMNGLVNLGIARAGAKRLRQDFARWAKQATTSS